MNASRTLEFSLKKAFILKYTEFTIFEDLILLLFIFGFSVEIRLCQCLMPTSANFSNSLVAQFLPSSHALCNSKEVMASEKVFTHPKLMVKF